MTHSAGPGRSERLQGRRAEDAAVAWLIRDGWQIVGRNVRLGHLELDVLARQGDVLAIVEVRFRGPASWLGALDSVDSRKREHLRAAARRLWAERLHHDESIRVVRFDVIVVGFDAQGAADVERIAAAFQ